MSFASVQHPDILTLLEWAWTFPMHAAGLQLQHSPLQVTEKLPTCRTHSIPRTLDTVDSLPTLSSYQI